MAPTNISNLVPFVLSSARLINLGSIKNPQEYDSARYDSEKIPGPLGGNRIRYICTMPHPRVSPIINGDVTSKLIGVMGSNPAKRSDLCFTL